MIVGSNDANARACVLHRPAALRLFFPLSHTTTTHLPPPQYQKAIRERAGDKIAGGKIIKVEAHPIPEHPRPRRVVGRVALIGDAAGYVTKCSGEGIYFAAKSGRMAAAAIRQLMKGGTRLPTEKEIKVSWFVWFVCWFGSVGWLVGFTWPTRGAVTGPDEGITFFFFNVAPTPQFK